MDAAQAAKLFEERVVPQLAELGVAALTCAALVEDGDGELHRVTFGIGSNNPELARSMNGVRVINSLWAQGVL